MRGTLTHTFTRNSAVVLIAGKLGMSSHSFLVAGPLPLDRHRHREGSARVLKARSTMAVTSHRRTVLFKRESCVLRSL